MMTIRQKPFAKLLFALLLLFTISGCGQVASESNYTLEDGKTISGTLFILSQNAILAENSSVDGSVIMLCCNLTVDGSVGGNVYLLTGNIKVSAKANVDGDVSVLTGTVSQ